jgi:hypothetical protein
LNMADLSQVDSSGVSVIVRTYVSVKRHGGDLILLCPGGRVLQVLTVLHLLDIIPSFDDEAQALASFGPRSYSASEGLNFSSSKIISFWRIGNEVNLLVRNE